MAENLTDPRLANKDKENKNKQDSIKNMNTLNKKQHALTTTNNKDDYYNKEKSNIKFMNGGEASSNNNQRSFTWQ